MSTYPPTQPHRSTTQYPHIHLHSHTDPPSIVDRSTQIHHPESSHTEPPPSIYISNYTATQIHHPLSTYPLTQPHRSITQFLYIHRHSHSDPPPRIQPHRSTTHCPPIHLHSHTNPTLESSHTDRPPSIYISTDIINTDPPSRIQPHRSTTQYLYIHRHNQHRSTIQNPHSHHGLTGCVVPPQRLQDPCRHPHRGVDRKNGRRTARGTGPADHVSLVDQSVSGAAAFVQRRFPRQPVC